MLDIISLTRIKTKLSSIRWRLSIAYLLIIGVAFSVVGVSLFQLVGEYLFNQRIKEDQRFAESLAEQLREPLDRMDAAALLRLSQEACADGGGRVLVLDPYGVVQSDTRSALNGTRFENLEAARVLSGGASEYGFYEDGQRSVRWSNAIWSLFSGVKSMSGVFAAPISGDEGLVGALVYVSQVQEIYQNLHEMQLKILTWLLVVAAAVILMNVFALRTITRPVSELREGIAKMSGGDFSAHVNVRGRNEFAELAEAFNSMSDRLGQLDKSRNQFVSNASHELKTPLSTMKILIETILYQDPLDPGMTKEFLNDVNKEIDRLNRIVSDLLTLVNIDSGGMKLNAAELDIRDLLLEQVKRLAPLARENGIELDCAARELRTLSGGQRQKAYLAMLIAQGAQNLLLDEPMTYLDVRHQLELLELLHALRGAGKCVVMVVHDLALACEAGDRALLLHEGAPLYDGPAGGLLASGRVETAFGVRPRPGGVRFERA